MKSQLTPLFSELKSTLSLSGTMQFHALLITTSSLFNTSLAVQILRFYAANGDILSAWQLFDEIPQKNVFAWNTMIRAYAKRHFFYDAFSLFHRMRSSGAKPDNYTYACVLRACIDNSDPDGVKKVHVCSIYDGLCSDPITSSALVSGYSKLGLVHDARQVFDKLPEWDLVLWNVMISGCGYHGHWREGLELFHELQDSGEFPDGYSLVGLISCFWDPGFLPVARGVHGFCLKGGYDSGEHVRSSLVSMYLRCKCLESGYKVFRNIYSPDLVTWSALISGFSQVGECKEALALFTEMSALERKPDAVLVASVLSACASMALVEPCRELHGHVFRSGMCSNISVSCALIDAYTKCGFGEAGLSVFKLMPVKNLVTYNSLIYGLGSHGRGKMAIDLFEDMLQEGFVPDQATFSALLCACCHSGLLKEGWASFRRMKEEFGIEPQTEQYLYMVKLLSVDGQLKEAYDLIQNMPISPDSGIWGALLSGCSIHGCSDLGEAVAHRLLEAEPRKAACRVILSNMYAATDKWGDVKILRDDIIKKRLHKTPGFSWIGNTS